MTPGRLALPACALVACGRLGFEPSSQPVQACEGFTPVLDLPGTYLVSANPLSTWGEARFDCFARGGDLAVPDTGSHATVLGNLIANAGEITAWIGVHDLEAEDAWTTVRGDPATLQPWNANEPNGGTGENCVRITDQGTYIDDDCFEIEAYVCACP